MTPRQDAERPPRTLPRGLAPLVEELELDQAHLVRTQDLERLRIRAGLSTPANVLAARLRERGWLLATPRRGVYEFAPGAHAGALSRGDVTLALQSFLRARPELQAGLTMQSAAWALDVADRAPTRLEIAVNSRAVARSLIPALGRRARILVFAPQLPWETRRSVPVLSADSVLVHMAAHPIAVRSWASALEWLPDLAALAATERLETELAGRPAAAAARLSYLLSGMRPDVAERIAPAPRGKVYFGPRGPLLRHDAHRQVADTVLPFDPRSLSAVDQ